MQPIVSLKARMSKAEAIELFLGGSLRKWLQSWRRGQLVGAREVYIPYRLFQVVVVNRGQEQVSWLALDAITAQLDPYRFESPPDQTELLRLETTAALPARLSIDEMRELLLEKIRRQVYLSGFFRLRDLRIEVESMGAVVYIPYWVGFYRKREEVSIDVIDAVRKQLEGGKLRDLIQGAFLQGGIDFSLS
jgi:hypothetical protein